MHDKDYNNSNILFAMQLSRQYHHWVAQKFRAADKALKKAWGMQDYGGILEKRLLGGAMTRFDALKQAFQPAENSGEINVVIMKPDHLPPTLAATLRDEFLLTMQHRFHKNSRGIHDKSIADMFNTTSKRFDFIQGTIPSDEVENTAPIPGDKTEVKDTLTGDEVETKDQIKDICDKAKNICNAYTWTQGKHQTPIENTPSFPDLMAQAIATEDIDLIERMRDLDDLIYLDTLDKAAKRQDDNHHLQYPEFQRLTHGYATNTMGEFEQKFWVGKIVSRSSCFLTQAAMVYASYIGGISLALGQSMSQIHRAGIVDSLELFGQMDLGQAELVLTLLISGVLVATGLEHLHDKLRAHMDSVRQHNDEFESFAGSLEKEFECLHSSQNSTQQS